MFEFDSKDLSQSVNHSNRGFHPKVYGDGLPLLLLTVLELISPLDGELSMYPSCGIMLMFSYNKGTTLIVSLANKIDTVISSF